MLDSRVQCDDKLDILFNATKSALFRVGTVCYINGIYGTYVLVRK